MKKLTLLLILSLFLIGCDKKIKYNYENSLIKTTYDDDLVSVETLENSTLMFIPEEKDSSSYISINLINDGYDKSKLNDLLLEFKNSLNENYLTSKQLNESNNKSLQLNYSLLDDENNIYTINSKIINNNENYVMIVLVLSDNESKELSDSMLNTYNNLTLK